MKRQAVQMRSEMYQELNRILDFWKRETIDEEHGGFYGEISSSMKIQSKAEKGLVLNARILWTYAIAFRFFGQQSDLIMAERAYTYLLEYFWDEEHGGLYWMVNYQGVPVNRRKQIYGQAFAIYAFSEYYRATGKQEALNYAVKLFQLIEDKSYDPINQGYYEACSEDWGPTDEYSLSNIDLNEKKSMNTHLHILEAYTNLYRVWKSDELKVKFTELIEVTMKHIVNPATFHLHLFFDEEWHVKSDIISFGHDIEGSWLLVEAAEVLGDYELTERIKEVAIQMAQAVYDKGLDTDGGLFNELDDNGHLDANKIWWPQAEAIVGFLNAYELTGKTYFFEAAQHSWEFTDSYICDKVNGEWHWQVSRDRIANVKFAKVNAWKCPYHNSRSCFEVMERLDRLELQ
ncbi:MAG: AGE family epimerase/isomerase [Paenibacillaceae bacterium]